MKLTKVIEAVGYGVSEEIGGIEKKVYYTPDGRQFISSPRVVTSVDKKTNRTMVRDSNLDKGWLLSKPTKLLPHCNNCGEWHKNKAEIIACGVRQTRLLASTKKAQKAHLKTLPKEWEEARGDTKSQILEKKVADLTKLVEQLLKEKENG